MTEAAVGQGQELAGLVKDSDKPTDASPIDEEKQVVVSQTDDRMEAWCSSEIELNNIILTEEQFSISAKVCVFWQDKKGTFSGLIDEETMEKIKAKGTKSRHDVFVGELI